MTRTIGTMLRKTGRAKFIDWPSAVYSYHPYDRVTVDGETVGVSTWIGYSAGEGKMLTLAVLEVDRAHGAVQVEIDRVDRQGLRQPPDHLAGDALVGVARDIAAGAAARPHQRQQLVPSRHVVEEARHRERLAWQIAQDLFAA